MCKVEVDEEVSKSLCQGSSLHLPRSFLNYLSLEKMRGKGPIIVALRFYEQPGKLLETFSSIRHHHHSIKTKVHDYPHIMRAA